jgi:Phage tail assembly chaperone proteins, E, or 41 or 14
MNQPQPREGFIEAEPVEEKVVSPATNGKAEEDELPPSADPAPDLWPMVIKLIHKPIQKSKNSPEIHELTFREPTARDIMSAGGNPCRIEITQIADGNLVYNPIIDDLKMIRVMANLTGILSPVLQSMDPRDYNSCAHRLRRYFLPEQGIW